MTAQLVYVDLFAAELLNILHTATYPAERQRDARRDGRAWLTQVGLVRPPVGALLDLEVLTAATTPGGGPAPGLAQVPHRRGPWAAVERPGDGEERLSILSVTGPEGLAVDEPIAGLFIDGWTEGIPRPAIQTGIAVHFDAPTARPPQAILLSVVDDERGFSADDLCDQLLHTIELAKRRCIGPDRLVEIGHYLPAVLLPAGTATSGGG